MPRKTKDVDTKETEKTAVKKTTSKAKKATSTTASKKVATKKSTSAKASSTKTATKNKTTTTKKTAVKKTTTRKKSTTTKKTNSDKKFINEYYDLPYRYNQTIVKILAQTPTKLFVYWDISDKDRENFKKLYGENFFETTKPVLIVHNSTMNYSFEVEINDFANSWYLPINDAKCEYNIELGRKPILNSYNQYTEDLNNNHVEQIPQYIYISSSNNLETPNDKILYNPPIYKKVLLRNIKTNQITEKDILDYKFIGNVESVGEFYDVYGLYAKFYKDEDFLKNPSSRATSSINF